MTMTKILTSVLCVTFLSACNSGGVWTRDFAPGKAEYDYIGCHKATETNISKDGSATFGPFGIGTWSSAGNVYFKQKSAAEPISPLIFLHISPPKTTLKKC